MKLYIFAALFIFTSLQLSAQTRVQRGIQFAGLASYDQYYLTENIENHVGIQYRSEDLFPNSFQTGYQFGFVKKKNGWNQSVLNLTYFPEFTRSYTEYKTDDGDWISLGTPLEQKMEIYMLDLVKQFKINLFDKKLYLTLGGGAGGGLIRWPDPEMNGNDYYFFTGQVYPTGGLELQLLKFLGVFGEFRYHYGISETISKTIDGSKYEWSYNLQHQEIKLGVNIYFKEKRD